MIPFRIKFIPVTGFDDSAIRRNIDHAAGFPRATEGSHVHPVAVCGGGPSLNDHLQELRAWPGDIWAINFTADYLLGKGIDCTLFTVDSAPFESKAKKRLIATNCDPSIFTGDVRCFDLCEFAEGGVPGGSTTASRAPALALRLGYPGAVFFGCDSSFVGQDHVDRDERLEKSLIVRANGQDYHTYPQYLLQAEGLAEILCEFPWVFKCQSDGLLSAMLKDPDWQVVAVSTAMKADLIKTNGDAGLYDGVYECLPE